MPCGIASHHHLQGTGSITRREVVPWRRRSPRKGLWAQDPYWASTLGPGLSTQSIIPNEGAAPDSSECKASPPADYSINARGVSSSERSDGPTIAPNLQASLSPGHREGAGIEGKAPDGLSTAVTLFAQYVTLLRNPDTVVTSVEEVPILAASLIEILLMISRVGILTPLGVAPSMFSAAPVLSFLVLVPGASAPDLGVMAPIPGSAPVSKTMLVRV